MNRNATAASPEYLRLTDEDWVIEALRTVPGLARMTAQLPNEDGRVHGADVASPVAFAVSGLNDNGRTALSTVLPIEVAHWPPLLLLSRRRLAGWEREDLRRQGVSAVLNIIEGIDRAPRILSALARSSEWFGASLTRAPLPDLLQMLAADGRSGMIWIGCPHAPALSGRRWDNGGTFCGGRQDVCAGWAARLHLHAGRLVYAETATHTGMDAFSRCLSLQHGYVRVHEVYMAPRRANLEGTVQQLLIEAATLADERDRDPKSQRAAPIHPSPLDERAGDTTARGDTSGLEAGVTGTSTHPIELTRPTRSRETWPGSHHSGAQTKPNPAQAAVPSGLTPEQLSADLENLSPPPVASTGDAAPTDVFHTHQRPRPPPLPTERPPAGASETDLAAAPPATSAAGVQASMVAGEPATWLQTTAGVRLVVDVDGRNQVIASAGDGDAESTAAVASLCNSAIDGAGAELGLGKLQGWSVVGNAQALYCQRTAETSRVGVGDASEHALRHLVKLIEGDTP